MNCRSGDLALVVRDTRGTCVANVIGSPLQLTTSFESVAGPAWLYRGDLLRCPNCGVPIFGFLDADLQPIRPGPAKTTTVHEEAPSGVEVLTQ